MYGTCLWTAVWTDPCHLLMVRFYTVSIVISLPEDRVLPCWHHGYIMATDYLPEAVGGDLRENKKGHLKIYKRIGSHVP